jgi:hypothetical protein
MLYNSLSFEHFEILILTWSADMHMQSALPFSLRYSHALQSPYREQQGACAAESGSIARNKDAPAANIKASNSTHEADVGCVAAFVLLDHEHGTGVSADSPKRRDARLQRTDRETAGAQAGCMCGHIQIRPMTMSLASACCIYSQSTSRDQICNGSRSADEEKSALQQVAEACTSRAHANITGQASNTSGQSSHRQHQQHEAPAGTHQECSPEIPCIVHGYETVVAGICMVERRNVSPRLLDGDHTYWVQDVSKTCAAMGMRQPAAHSPTWTQGWFSLLSWFTLTYLLYSGWAVLAIQQQRSAGEPPGLCMYCVFMC